MTHTKEKPYQIDPFDIFKNYIAAPVLTVEAYFDFKVILPKHWSGLGLPTAIKRRLESINFSKKYAHS